MNDDQVAWVAGKARLHGMMLEVIGGTGVRHHWTIVLSGTTVSGDVLYDDAALLPEHRLARTQEICESIAHQLHSAGL